MAAVSFSVAGIRSSALIALLRHAAIRPDRGDRKSLDHRLQWRRGIQRRDELLQLSALVPPLRAPQRPDRWPSNAIATRQHDMMSGVLAVSIFDSFFVLFY